MNHVVRLEANLVADVVLAADAAAVDGVAVIVVEEVAVVST